MVDEKKESYFDSFKNEDEKDQKGPERLSDFAERTSCHGPKMIAISETVIRKNFWCLAFITVICFLISQMVIQINHYNSERTFQDVRNAYAVSNTFFSIYAVLILISKINER